MRRLLDRDPIVHCFVDARMRVAGIDSWRMGGELWGAFENGSLVSALFCGANMVPIATTRATREVFVMRLRAVGRRCSSIVGPADEVLSMWESLKDSWGPCRELRANQPLLVMDSDPLVDADPGVRLVRPQELETIFPACVAMFTDEVGVSPLTHGGGHAYRARIAELIGSGRSLGRIDDGAVVFKAEIGAATPDACQVQGVWLAPELRGRGLSVPAMAAVVRIAREEIAPVVSLYVNDYNEVARRAYASCGFVEHAVFATVLF